MKGKGILVLIAMLFLLPVTVDLILFLFLDKSVVGWNMTMMMYSGYLGVLPFFIAYLIIAFTILYLIKQYRKTRRNQK